MARVPVTCASIFASRQEALDVPAGDVNLVACNVCGFVFNRSFDAALGAISARYESSQAASAHFGAFARSLARDWIARHDLRGRTVLEVGCGGADFLRLMLSEGVGTGIGIDPCCDPGAAFGQANMHLIADVFDTRALHLQAHALVCRHTIEHIGDVRGFLLLLREWALRNPGAVLLFELPASERIFTERAFWDVYYEHCNYFTERTIRLAFEIAGFEVRRAERVYDGQYLIVEASVTPVKTVTISDTSAALGECRAFGAAVNEAVERCRERLRTLTQGENAGAPLVLWQGASKTVGFLSAVGASMVDSAVDLSPQRQGRFLPGSGLQVHAPAELTRLQPRHVVLMNAVYLREVQAQVQTLGVPCRVHAVNDLLAETFVP
jgi:methyltransferase family protein/C-methyltransferase-like protein